MPHPGGLAFLSLAHPLALGPFLLPCSCEASSQDAHSCHVIASVYEQSFFVPDSRICPCEEEGVVLKPTRAETSGSPTVPAGACDLGKPLCRAGYDEAGDTTTASIY